MTTERHWITHLMTCHAWGITGGRVFSNRLNASNSQERQGSTNMYKKNRLLLFVQLPSARKSNKEERETEFFSSLWIFHLCFFSFIPFCSPLCFWHCPPFSAVFVVWRSFLRHTSSMSLANGKLCWVCSSHDMISHNSACRPPQLMLTGADQPPQCIRGKRRRNCCVSPDLHQYSDGKSVLWALCRGWTATVSFAKLLSAFFCSGLNH